MRMSDPEVLSYICKSLHKPSKKPLPQEILNLLKAPAAELSVDDCEADSDSNNESDDSSDESDNSDEYEDVEVSS